MVTIHHDEHPLITGGPDTFMPDKNRPIYVPAVNTLVDPVNMARN